ncbi:hypothetical protein, partial [Staphylococcus sp. GDK8D30P]|uniref:hypothetical protein n=1 Tax=Staphylococcus sp. GDK8D30P TaxID=2804090 RepID=UPI001AEC6042
YLENNKIQSFLLHVGFNNQIHEPMGLLDLEMLLNSNLRGLLANHLIHIALGLVGLTCFMLSEQTI